MTDLFPLNHAGIVRRRTIGAFDYLAPTSLEQAIDMLTDRAPGGKILNGGTDLVVQMKQGVLQPKWVLDIKRIPELQHLEYNAGGGLRIGAGVTLSRILACSALPVAYRMLQQACSVIGSAQIKNRGTVAGNICNASPSADAAPPLLCLDAKVVLVSRHTIRTVDLKDFFLGPGQTVMETTELMTEIQIPAPAPGSAGCYMRHTTREEMDIALVGAGAWLTVSGKDHTVSAARIALGAVAPTPLRIFRAEECLLGKPLSGETVEQAACLAAAQTAPISDVRGGAEYRRKLVVVLTRRALRTACAELGVPLAPENTPV